jgi:hypothetical protein
MKKLFSSKVFYRNNFLDPCLNAGGLSCWNEERYPIRHPKRTMDDWHLSRNIRLSPLTAL